MGLIKNYSDIRALKHAGHIVQTILSVLCREAKPGVSTLALEALANQQLRQARSSAPFKTFEGFNHAICVSLNQEIVNGPPSRERIIQPGDVVSIATAAESRGIHAKAARTIYVGDNPPEDIRRLLTGTSEVITQAIQRSTQVATLNELLKMIPDIAAQYGLITIRDLGGAGIGKKLHDAPLIPNQPEQLEVEIPLQTGLCFTLMPMFSLGQSPDFKTHEDGWTLLTHDGALSAHAADTLLMEPGGLVNITGNPCPVVPAKTDHLIS